MQHFGKAGHWYYRISRGIDDRPVSTSRERKSLSAERTFSDDLATLHDMDEKLSEIAEEVARRMAKCKLTGRTVTVKIKYHDFVIATRSRTVPSGISSTEDITAVARMLLHGEPPKRPVRLLGIGIAKLRETDSVGAQLVFDLPGEK